MPALFPLPSPKKNISTNKSAEEILREFQTFHLQQGMEKKIGSLSDCSGPKMKNENIFHDFEIPSRKILVALAADSTFSWHQCTVIYLFAFLIVRVVMLMKFRRM